MAAYAAEECGIIPVVWMTGGGSQHSSSPATSTQIYQRLESFLHHTSPCGCAAAIKSAVILPAQVPLYPWLVLTKLRPFSMVFPCYPTHCVLGENRARGNGVTFNVSKQLNPQDLLWLLPHTRHGRLFQSRAKSILDWWVQSSPHQSIWSFPPPMLKCAYSVYTCIPVCSNESK